MNYCLLSQDSPSPRKGATMSLNVQECVARAEECRRRAEETEDSPLREQFLSLHQGFLRHARQIEAHEQTIAEGE